MKKPHLKLIALISAGFALAASCSHGGSSSTPSGNDSGGGSGSTSGSGSGS